MTRRLLAFLTVLLLLNGCALAQSTTMLETYSVEGNDETGTVTLFESMYGYTLWYDAARMVYVAPSEGTNEDLFVPSKDAQTTGVFFSVVMGGKTLDYTLENALEDQRRTLEENGYDVVSQDSEILTGVSLSGIEEIRVLETDRGFYYVTVRYPFEAAEGWGARLSRMADSFLPQPALRLSFENDAPFVKPTETIDLSKEGTRTVLWADETLTQVTLFRVQSVDGNTYTKQAQLFSAATLKALSEGVLLITQFPDAVPDLLAEYTDAEGVHHTVLLTQSGRDGRLLTVPADEK